MAYPFEKRCKIDVLAALLKVQQGIEDRKASVVNLLPYVENAIIDIRKLRNYCLSPEHDDGKHKARLFSATLGMTVENAEELRQILLEAIKTHEARLGRQDEFGQRYTLDFTLEGKIEVQPFGVVGSLSMVQKFQG